MKFFYTSIFLFLGFCPNALVLGDTPAVTPLDQTDIPIIVYGASPVFDDALINLINGLKNFHDSPAFLTVMYFVFIICMTIGILWKTLGLMYGHTELGEFLLWGFMRFCLGFGLFFMSLHLTFLLVETQNVLAKMFNTKEENFSNVKVRPDSEFSGILLGLESVVREFDAKALRKFDDVEVVFGDDITKQLQSYIGWMVLHQKYSNADASERLGFSGSCKYGFPLLNYGLKLSYTEAFEASNMVDKAVLDPADKIVYGDVEFPLYTGDGLAYPYVGYLNTGLYTGGKLKAFAADDLPPKVPVQFIYRPFLPSVTALRSHVLARAKEFKIDSPTIQNDITDFVNIEMPFYYLMLDKMVRTYLADYVSFGLHHKDPLFLANLSGVDQLFNGSNEGVNLPTVDAGLEFAELLKKFEDDLYAYNKKSSAFDMGSVLSLVVSFSLAVVSFYAAISVWSLPILLKIWASFFWLPKQFEFSGALIKGAKYILVLVALPVFGVLVVEIALAFSDAIDNAVAISMKPLELDLHLNPWEVMVGNFTDIFKDAGMFFLWLALRVAVWVFSALFIIGMPKLLSSILSGAGSLAEGVLSKVGMSAAGGAFAANMLVTAPGVTRNVVRYSKAPIGAVVKGGVNGVRSFSSNLLKRLTD